MLHGDSSRPFAVRSATPWAAGAQVTGSTPVRRRTTARTPPARGMTRR
ncbi:hypothetical protein FAIPA1_110042 [Frankia sp. AiPs1]